MVTENDDAGIVVFYRHCALIFCLLHGGVIFSVFGDFDANPLGLNRQERSLVIQFGQKQQIA